MIKLSIKISPKRPKAEEKEIPGHLHTAHSKYIRTLITCCNPTPLFMRETQLLDLGPERALGRFFRASEKRRRHQ